MTAPNSENSISFAALPEHSARTHSSIQSAAVAPAFANAVRTREHMMRNNQQLQKDDGIPRFEPWLAVAAGALLPSALSLFLPATFLVPLIVVTVAMFALSLGMWWRQKDGAADRQQGAES